MDFSVKVVNGRIELSVGHDSESLPASLRPGKGNGIIAFPSEYCMVDIETTGLSPEWDDIIEIGAIRYRNGVEVDRFQSLAQPPTDNEGNYVSSFIEKLTGITNAMLEAAPSMVDVIHRFDKFLGDSIILGYNVCFDVNFIYDTFEAHLRKPLTNDYMDVRRLARRICPDLPRYRLKDMLVHYDIEHRQTHRAISDCEATEEVYRRLYADGLERFGSEDAIVRLFFSRGYPHAHLKASDIQANESNFNLDCPLYQRHCVITGKLDRFTRAQAMQLIADLGGINDDNVTKKTNFLILGNNDYCTTIKGGKSSKQKKAEAMKLDGQDIEIIPETVFYDMIAEYMAENNTTGE